jgi:integrase
MRRRSEARVCGPYREAVDKWRIVLIDANGSRQSKIYGSRANALRAMPSAHRELWRHRALPPLVVAYVAGLLAVPTTRAATKSLLLTMFTDTIGEWCPNRAARSLEKWARRWSVATQRLYLHRCRAFWAWLVHRKMAKANPFESLTIVGKSPRGKPQLRLDEARKLCAVCLASYEAGDVAAAAPVLLLSLGLRTSELLLRRCRDVDDGGALLWIDAGKTQNARRMIDVPSSLQPLLRSLTAGRGGDAWLFPRGDGHLLRQCLHTRLQKLCKRAGVPVVCPHSLRGLHATLALRGGTSAAAVAAALGHASFEVTARHYAQPGSDEGPRSAAVTSQLFRE